MASRHGRSIVLALKKYGESTYTPIAQVDDISGGGWIRNMVNADGYGSTAIGKVGDPAIELNTLTVRGRLDDDEATHDEATGLQKWASVNEPTTFELRGPDYSAPSTDVLRMSAEVTGFTFLTPKDDLSRFEVVFTPDGSDLYINGVTLVTQTV